MSKHVIEVADLSKSFTIKHNQDADTHRTIRDLLAHRAKKIVSSRKAAAQPASEIFWALKDISFTIDQGDCVGIVGSNGAGKSTLLKILSRITAPTSGSVHVSGRVVSLLEVGTGFHPELSGRENIFLNGVILGMKRSEIKKRFDEIVAFAGVEQFLDMPVKKYSSGMHMRLAFAVAAHMEPEILIVDEMLAVGDAAFQKKCIARMEEISRNDGRTVLFVSHSIEAVRILCETAIFLEKGRLLAQGDIKTVTDQYIASVMPEKKGFVPNTHKEMYINDLHLSATDISFGSTIQLRCEIFSAVAADEYALGIGIFSNMGVRVGSDVITGRGPLQPGSNIMDIQIPLGNLIPGTYTCSFALALHNLNDVKDVVADYPVFTIHAGQQKNDLFARWHSSWGDTILNATLQ